MDDTEKIGCCGALQNMPRISENLQGMQAGVSGRLAGASPGKMRHEGLLPDQGAYHLCGLRKV